MGDVINFPKKEKEVESVGAGNNPFDDREYFEKLMEAGRKIKKELAEERRKHNKKVARQYRLTPKKK